MRFLLTLLCGIGFVCTGVRAQDGPKIGLVLSGGGAKGYAHIGALRVIEEAGVKIDYIGGTSMGAIVGGLYAAGYSADQLEYLLRSIDIMAELQDAVEREDRTIYEKLYNEKYLISLSMEDFGIQLPTALSDGQRVHDLFAHWTAHVGHVRDFGELPVPYLCVATDLETGDEVVIERGMLAEAMRASAALPGVLSPFIIDGRLLTDGGVSNNYPAEEIKTKGMDYVLGVSVESNPLTAEEINSVGSLMMQIAFFQANRRNVQQYDATDLDIRPQLEDFTVLSFADIDSIIHAGYVAARALRPQLDSLAALQGRTVGRRDTSPPRLPENLNVRFVSIDGSQELSNAQVLSFFDNKLPGRISWEEFREGLTALHVTGRYANINYQWSRVEGAAGLVDLALQFETRPAFGQQLRLGLHYDQLYRANLLVNLTLYDLIVDNSLASLDVIAGTLPRYRFDYRVNRVNGTAFGLRSSLDYVDVDLSVDATDIAELGIVLDGLDFRFLDVTTEAYWNLRQGPNSLTGIAAGLKYYRKGSDQITAADTSGEFAVSDDLYFVPQAYYIQDRLDEPNFPLRGLRLHAVARGVRDLSGRVGWTFNADVQALGMLPIGERLSLGLEVSAGGFLGGDVLPYRYYLGSNNRLLMNNFRPFPSIEAGGASGSGLAMAEGFLRWRPFLNHYLHLGGRFAYLDSQPDIASSIDTDWLAAGVLGYGIASPLGPIELTYAYGSEGGGLYFNLGYWF